MSYYSKAFPISANIYRKFLIFPLGIPSTLIKTIHNEVHQSDST